MTETWEFLLSLITISSKICWSLKRVEDVFKTYFEYVLKM